MLAMTLLKMQKSFHARIQKVLSEGVQLWQRNFLFYFMLMIGGWSKISLKAGHHRPTSETPLNGVSLACRRWPNIEYWVGSFVIFQGTWTSIDNESFIFGGRGPLPLPLWIFTSTCSMNTKFYLLNFYGIHFWIKLYIVLARYFRDV